MKDYIFFTLCALEVLRNVVTFCYTLFRDVDKNRMDDYDRIWGIAGEGRTRGFFGTIYNSKGEYDFWENIKDTNPLYSY